LKNSSFLLAQGLTILFLGGASCAQLKPAASEPKKPILERGWSFIESEAELINQDAGAPEINFTSAALDGGRLIYGSARFGLMVLEQKSGRLIWRKQIPGGVGSNVLVRDKKIFVGGEDGLFRAFSSESGQELWTSNLKFPASGTPALAQGKLLVGTIDHAVHALDPSTGKVLWTFRRGATSGTTIRGGGSAAFINGKFWVGFADGTLVALDPNDGAAAIEKQYQDNPKFTDIDGSPVSWKRGVLVASYDGRLRFLNTDGSLQWVFPAGGARSPVASNLFGGTIFFGSSDGYVYAIQDGSAKELWKFPVKKGVPTGIALLSPKKNPVLVVASSDNFIYSLDPKTGKELERESLGSSSGSYGEILVEDNGAGDQIYIVSHTGRIHEFRFRN
jgi:outer membrane protein assembly factor BamB